MTNCPHCGANIDEDFGLVDCVDCGASLFVDINGHIQASNEAEPEGASSQSFNDPQVDEDLMSTDESQEDDYESEGLDESWIEESEEDSIENDPAIDEQVGLDENSSIESGVDEVLPTNEFDDEAGILEGDDHSQYDSDQMEESAEQLEYPNSEPTDASEPNFSDVNDFANAEVSSGQGGAFLYRIQISGIDSSEIREELRLALLDRAFLWDADELLSSIDQGVLVIENVSAVKAHVFLQRIKNLFVNVSWEQHAIHQL